MPIELLPVGVFLLGALVAGLTNARLAAAAALLTPIAAGLCSLALLAPGATASWTIMDYELNPVRVDHFSLVMVGLFHLAALTAGVTLLAGILILGGTTGDWRFGHVGLAAPGGWLVLLAFGIKSGFPLLHNWITDGYPKASLTGLAVLAVVTTKVGIYGLARAFAGEGILVGIGTVMALWPLFYTLVENDLRRVLAYSMMVQLGLMVAAVGVGSALALDGVVLHIVMDVLFKMVLFMALGAVALRVGTTRGDRLGGLWQAMPLTTACVAVAVAANSALPLTGGFISKKVLLSGIEHSDVPATVWLFLVSTSALGILYAGLRILWQGFLRPGAHGHGEVRDAPWPMVVAMLIPVVLLLLTGVFPGLTDALRPHGTDYWPLHPAKAVDQAQMLLFAALVYALLARAGFGLPEPGPAAWLDAEWLYLRGLPAAAGGVHAVLARMRESARSMLGRIFQAAADDGRLGATLGRTWPIGSMALWVAILLAALLLFGIRQA